LSTLEGVERVLDAADAAGRRVARAPGVGEIWRGFEDSAYA
jgi:hypothetical protein